MQDKSAGENNFKNNKQQESCENNNIKKVNKETRDINMEIKNETATEFKTKGTYAQVAKNKHDKRF